MIHSMTGYGKSKAHLDNKSVIIEIRALNSKQADVNMKVAPIFKSREIDIRKKVVKALERGKIDVNVSCDYHPGHTANTINVPLFNSYVSHLKSLAEENQLPQDNIINTVMRIPNIMMAQEEGISNEEWTQITEALEEALSSLNSFRAKEGEDLKQDLEKHSEIIKGLSEDIKALLPERIEKVKERLRKAMEANAEKGRMNTNRLEEEFIFYIEKLDINEETVRLATHIENFKNTIETEQGSHGRKLGFISQEMGREINTIGAKANYAPIQSKVVNMKESLDKIKEQLYNIL